MRGKFLFLGEEKLYVKGVTYGTFRPAEDGSQYPEPEVVERDFAVMSNMGANVVRTYTVPPLWLLDAAHRHGLFVLVGVAWEQHVAFLDDRGRSRDIEQRVRAGVRACAGHPAVLAYAIGNEIPGPVVRWHGRHRVGEYLKRLHESAKEEDPTGLVTYVNYPPTEYLDLSFADFSCFNVYLEEPRSLDGYLARLHNLAGERPVVLAEIGLDSRRNGSAEQARSLEWQLASGFAAGCAGAIVFAWTDEWYVNYLSDNGNSEAGAAIEDWDFGLTDRGRSPKPALGTVRRAFSEAPFGKHYDWPRVSVIVCTYNGARTIRNCLDGLAELDYPEFEVIVVDDGSTDATASIVSEYEEPLLISTANRGLSSARNTGLKAATGELIAYIDDDARPDREWLKYIAAAFRRSKHVAIGGPNIPPPEDGHTAACVANAPGGPTHVLLSDTEAEHIPGCNAAFRKDALDAIGGFDPRFHVAGDDVDVCWRLRDRGWTLGFSPAAVVWHHRRSSIRAYWRQQRSYGKAEALLERKWPERYDAGGHLTWRGRLYGGGGSGLLLGRRRARIYHGAWGCAPFQSIYEPSTGVLGALPSMPEWYLLIAVLGLGSALSLVWWPLLGALPLLAATIGVVVARAVRSASLAAFPDMGPSRTARLHLRAVTTLLILIQPLARLLGRAREGLTPWRRSGLNGLSAPYPRKLVGWSEVDVPTTERLHAIEERLRTRGAVVTRGGDYDAWDLDVRDGSLGAARVRTLVEEHGAGHQLVRFRVFPRVPLIAVGGAASIGLLAIGAALDGAWLAAFVTALAAIALVLRLVLGCGTAMATLLAAIDHPQAAREHRSAALQTAKEPRT